MASDKIYLYDKSLMLLMNVEFGKNKQLGQ